VNALKLLTVAFLALLAGCKAPKKPTPEPAGFKEVVDADFDPPRIPDGHGAHRMTKDRQEFIDMGNGSWWCVVALEKRKPVSWCGWAGKRAAESQAKAWRSEGVPGDTTNVKVVEAKRIYFIEKFGESLSKAIDGSYALDLESARKTAKDAQAFGFQVKWHLFTRAEYFDACYDLPACR
jgi:hypothetical protein